MCSAKTAFPLPLLIKFYSVEIISIDIFGAGPRDMLMRL